jgi:hypothetical protein
MKLLGGFLLWRLWRRRRKARRRAGDHHNSDTTLSELLLARADLMLDNQFGNSDVLDLKAVGLLTADVAAVTILAVVPAAVGKLWWVPALLMIGAGAYFLRVVRTRDWDVGPDLDAFREEQYRRSPLQMTDEMLADVVLAMTNNLPLVDGKARMFRNGYRLLAASLLVAVGLALGGPS